MKNINSIRFMQQAIIYEANRQVDILESGGTVDQETRLYDPDKGETRSMRSKEEAHDYRYFPDPDLLPLEFDDAFIERIRADLPELPDDKKARFINDLGLSAYDAGILVGEKEVADYFEAVAAGRDAKLAANWVIGELFGQLNRTGKSLADTPVDANALGELIDLIKDGKINNRIAKEVFEEMFDTGEKAADIVDKKGLTQVSDTGAIEAAIDAVIAANPDKVAEYRSGKDKLFGFFMGQVMKATQGKANPAVVTEILKPKLDG